MVFPKSYIAAWSFVTWLSPSADCDFISHLPKCEIISVDRMLMKMVPSKMKYECSVYYKCEVKK